jgi:hypothetical protein
MYLLPSLLSLIGTLQSIRLDTPPVAALHSEFPSYHSTESIHSLLLSFQSSCATGIRLRSVPCGEDCSIDIVDVGNLTGKNSSRVFLLFGEHSRELISPDTALGLIEDLCSLAPSASVRSVREATHFRIIPLANPTGRRAVEAGDACRRVSANGVDLNRNWDARWSPAAPDTWEADQLNPGASPFSEPETRVIRDSVVSFSPNAFVTLHSGTRGMYMPWAVNSTEAVGRNHDRMRAVLTQLDDQFCQCPFGAAGAQVGYSSPGTSLDWVFSNTPVDYAYAFEIFDGFNDGSLRPRWERLRGGASLIQTPNCFKQFNPVTNVDYRETVDNWKGALVELARLVVQK